MWLSLFLLIFLVAIAYFHAIQGLFSALLSAVLCLLCAALAFATFEYIAINVFADFKPNFAMGLALAGMFAIPLLILRTVLDKLIQRGCLLPAMLDRVGGLAFGALASFIMVGMLAVCLQLMPFGSGFLAFARVDREDPAQEEQNELWLSPDRFAVKMASMFSDGVFSGSESFTKAHPDFVTEIGWIEAVIPTDQADRRHVRRFAPPDSMRVVGAWEEAYTYTKTIGGRDEGTEYDPKSAEKGNKYIRVRMSLTNEAQDLDKKHRFTLYQVRLVGDEGNDARQYHAIGVADTEQTTTDAPPRAITELQGRGDVPLLRRLFGATGGNLVDVVFEVPESFKPRLVAYKAGARQPIKLGQPVAGGGPAPVSAGAGPLPSGGTPAAGTSGSQSNRVSGVAMTGSFFGDSFPGGMILTRYRGTDADIDNSTLGLRQGHIHGEVQAQGRSGGRGTPLSKFVVPPDKRLLHLSVQKLRPRSTLGKALNLAVTTMKNYVLVDSQGREYLPVGTYAISKLGITPYFEIQYYPEYAEITGRGIRGWAKLRENRIRPDDTYVLLYLVEPGAKMKSFRTGGGGARAVDLEDKDLTAPP